MRNADKADLFTVNGDVKAVYGMLKIIITVCAKELYILVKDVRNKLANSI